MDHYPGADLSILRSERLESKNYNTRVETHASRSIAPGNYSDEQFSQNYVYQGSSSLNPTHRVVGPRNKKQTRKNENILTQENYQERKPMGR